MSEGRRMRALVPIFLVSSAACKGLTNPSTSDLPLPPDIIGHWTVPSTIMGPGNPPDTTTGSCTVAEFSIQLDSSVVEGDTTWPTYLYSGSHTSTMILCRGAVESATIVFGMTDTVSVVAGAPMEAELTRLGCIGFGDCSSAGSWLFSMSLGPSGLGMLGTVQNGQIVGGLTLSVNNALAASGGVAVTR